MTYSVKFYGHHAVESWHKIICTCISLFTHSFPYTCTCVGTIIPSYNMHAYIYAVHACTVTQICTCSNIP